MKKSARTVKRALSVVLMVILMLNLCGFTYCMEKGSVNIADSVDIADSAQKVTGKTSAITIPKGLTPEAASEYLEIVKGVCSEYGPEQLVWRDGDLLPHRVGFCGGLFVNLNGDDVPEMILEYREDDRKAEDESDAGVQIWTWRNGAPYQSLETGIASSTPNGVEFTSVLLGKDRDYLKYRAQQNELNLDDLILYPGISKDGEYDRYANKDFSDESKYTEVKLTDGNKILLANSDHFLYTLASAVAAADGRSPKEILAEMGYVIDPAAVRGATEEYDPAAAPVGADGNVDWYGVLRALHDNNPKEFADTSILTAKVQSHDDAGWNVRDGILGADLRDLSGDGKDDLVLYRILSSDYMIPHEVVWIEMYTCRDGKICDPYVISVNENEQLPLTGVGYSSVRTGLTEVDGRTYIWTENIQNSYFANGSDFVVKIFGFEWREMEDCLCLQWVNGKTEGDTNGVVFSLQTFGKDSISFPETDELLWTDDQGNGNNGPCADPGAAVEEGYKRIGFPDTAVYNSDPSTDTGNTGDQYRDQFPTYWNTDAVKKSLQIMESGPASADHSGREMTSRIDDYTGLEEAIRKQDSAYSEYMEFLKGMASGNPSKKSSSDSTEKKGSSSSPSSGAAGDKSSSSGAAGDKSSSSSRASGDKSSSSGTAGDKSSSSGAGAVSKDVKAGDTVTFGSYGDSADGKRIPVQWTVLENKGGEALLISKYGLDCIPYNDEWVDTTWEKASLRTWLNSTFLEEAFSSEERQNIVAQKVTNRDNKGNPGGDPTTDQIFILDIKELEKYFDSAKDRKAEATEFAQSRGAFVDEKEDACWYWVRNPGDNARYAAYVNCKGDILDRGNLVFGNTFAVRPALRVKTR